MQLLKRKRASHNREVGQYHLCPMAIASKTAKSSAILRSLPYLLRSCGLAVLHRDNLNFRTIIKAEHNSAISVYRRTIQQVNPQSLVPGLQNEGLFFYRPNENSQIPISLHPVITLCGGGFQFLDSFFIPLFQSAVLLFVFFLGLLRGCVFLDAFVLRHSIFCPWY